MKDKRFITVVAIILCLTLILGIGFPSLASDEKGEGTQTEGQTAEPTETPAVNDVTAPESLPVVTETPEPTETPEGTEALLAVSEPVTPVPSQTPDADGTPDTSNGTPAVDPGPTPDAEEKNSDPEPSPTPSELPVSPDAQTDIPSEVDKEEVLQGFEAAYTDEDVNIEVTALPGVLPKDAVLKVVPVIWQEIPEEAEEEERSRLEEINSKYELTRSKLEESVAEQEDTIMVGFKAYDISFCITNEETGEESEIEPVGDVSVKMNFSNPIVPEEAAGSEDQEDPESPENQPAPMILDDSEALPEIRPAVKHLKEDENAEGGVSLIDITEQ